MAGTTPLPSGGVATISVRMKDKISSTRVTGEGFVNESDEQTLTTEDVRCVPAGYALDQNYPNPFNPFSTIAFRIPSRSFVSLTIHDMMGRDAATIVSEDLSAGNYRRQWNASVFPSGMYFYRLQAGAYTDTKRLILLK